MSNLKIKLKNGGVSAEIGRLGGYAFEGMQAKVLTLNPVLFDNL